MATAQTATELETHVTYLASDELQGRDTGSEGYAKAAKYVYEQCKEYGLQVEYQPVRVAGGKCKNVIAQLVGENTERVIIIGAHLDHIGTTRRGTPYNGADDNSSGSAAVLGLAKRFAEGPKPRYTITFQWYTAEERGLLGSKYYVKNPLLPKGDPDISKHIFMLNLDMIGRYQQILGAMDDPDVPAILREFYEKYPLAKDVTFRNNSGSDHRSFEGDMPVIFLHTGLHSDYHRTTDDSDKLNYDGMEQICEYAYTLVNMILGESLDYNLWVSLPVYKGKP